MKQKPIGELIIPIENNYTPSPRNQETKPPIIKVKRNPLPKVDPNKIMDAILKGK
jgi:hypothetical protein